MSALCIYQTHSRLIDIVSMMMMMMIMIMVPIEMTLVGIITDVRDVHSHKAAKPNDDDDVNDDDNDDFDNK